MIKNQANHIGEAICAWDLFYENNYPWLYLAALSQQSTAEHAAQLSDRILLNVLLKHPELVKEKNTARLKQVIAVLYPEVAEALSDQSSSAESLMKDFYSAN